MNLQKSKTITQTNLNCDLNGRPSCENTILSLLLQVNNNIWYKILKQYLESPKIQNNHTNKSQLWFEWRPSCENTILSLLLQVNNNIWYKILKQYLESPKIQNYHTNKSQLWVGWKTFSRNHYSSPCYNLNMITH